MDKNFVCEAEIYQVCSFTGVYIKVLDGSLATDYPHSER